MTRGSIQTAILVCALAALVAAPAFGQAKDHNKIKFPKLPELTVPQPGIHEMDNGMTVFLMEDHELPLISVSVMIRTGSNYDPAEKVGLASLVGQVLREGGTSSMNGDEIDDYLAVRAAHIETGMGGDAGYAGMNCLKEDFADVFGLFADILRKPAFAEDKLDLAKLQATTGIARRNDAVDGITRREFGRLVYGEDSPLGRMDEYSTIGAITQDDLVAWHARYYHPNNILLGVVGDFDSETMKSTIQTVFGDWEKGPAFDEPEVPYRKEPNKGIFFIEKSDVAQANIVMGHLGTTEDNPDLYAIEVMNEVLGGGFASRLFSNVRSEKGLAYNVYGGVGTGYLRPGLFRVGLQTALENTTEAIAALKEEITGIIENPATAEEMARAKDVILNSFIFNYTSREAILDQQMTYTYYGMPLDFLETYQANIEKVKAEDVARVAKKYVNPEDLALLVVGKSAEIDPALSTVGEVTTVDISIPPPPDTGPEIIRDAETLAAGAAIFDRVVQSSGGGDPDGIAGYSGKGEMAITMPQGAMSMGLEVMAIFPDRMRMSLQTPMGAQVVVVDGDTGFAGMGGQFQDLPAEAIDGQRENFYRDPFYLTARRDDAGLEAVAVDSDEVDGVACDVVAVTFNETETLFCVAEDGKLLKATYQGEHPFTRAPGTIETVYTEYRDVDGRPVPFKEVQTFNGDPMMTTEWKSFEFNPEVDDTTFAKPGS